MAKIIVSFISKTHLRNLKEYFHVRTYDRVIEILLDKSKSPRSFAGIVGTRKGVLEKALKELQEERRNSDRF